MDKPQVQEKKIDAALCQFLFPFSIREGCQLSLQKELKESGFDYFHLDQEEQEWKYYGSSHRVSHRGLERYYLPFASSILFPHSEEEIGFQRYSLRVEMDAKVRFNEIELGFILHSVDITLCPFNLGFVTLRIELAKEELTYTQALEFIKQFRQLENVLKRKDYPVVCCRGAEYQEVESFLFMEVVPAIKPYLDFVNSDKAYFETLSFFVDERMYAQAFFMVAEGEELSVVDVYRAGQLNGMDAEGRPYVSAHNMQYIKEYCRTHVYSRWAPYTYFVVDDDAFICLTKETQERADKLADQMYGEYYYSLLLNFFHKIVLLKLSVQYPAVQVDKDNKDIGELIRSITEFDAKYFFVETVSQTQGKELFGLLRIVFRNNDLYEDVKSTLGRLFQYQEKFTSRRNNHLLMILTIYTVIGGIYGMNQVIDDLKGNIDWGKMLKYSFFEYIALFVTFSGLIVAAVMGVIALVRWIQELVRTWK